MEIEEILSAFVASLPEDIRQQVSVDSETVEGRVYLRYEYTDEEKEAGEPSPQAEQMWQLWDAWPDSCTPHYSGVDSYRDKYGDDVVVEYHFFEVENEE